MSLSTTATINTVVNDTNYRYISFTTVGSTNLIIYEDLICDILLVGGGGAGGYNGGGGGGGGQVLYYTDNNDLTFKSGDSITLKKGSYTINIGAGGTVTGVTDNINPSNGSMSSIINSSSQTILSVMGGGAGGSKYNIGNGGNVGGVGGLGHIRDSSLSSDISLNNGGNGGINDKTTVNGGGGGGGGANISYLSKNGSNSQSTIKAGNGGAGINCSITGINTQYGGGGGGGSYIITGGTATHGGGNGGSSTTSAGQSGTVNTGGGGGGGGNVSSGFGVGGLGGSGIIIIRYLKSNIEITGTLNTINNNLSQPNYKYISFIQNGTLTLTSDLLCDIIIIGGGGSGGSRHGGGGGAGSVIYLNNLILYSGTYGINIGIGGAAVNPSNGATAINGNNGGDTTFSFNSTVIYTAKGGGGGGGGTLVASVYTGLSGGSSGGTSGQPIYSNNVLMTNLPLGYYGNLGGKGSITGAANVYGGGGGGGASNIGGDANQSSVNAIGGNGGNGLFINITGVYLSYGGGGGGGISSTGNLAGIGGLGGGGNGSKGANTASDGINNTGGGGGGSGFTAGTGTNGTSGKGGDGVVIIKYLKMPSNKSNNHSKNISYKSNISLNYLSKTKPSSLKNIRGMNNIKRISNIETDDNESNLFNITISGSEGTISSTLAPKPIFISPNDTNFYMRFLHLGSTNTTKTFNYTEYTIRIPFDMNVELLLVGGGGGGGGYGSIGSYGGSGGGAGGLIHIPSLSLKESITYKIIVGAGGLGMQSNGSQEINGTSSIFYENGTNIPLLTALGGARGTNTSAISTTKSQLINKDINLLLLSGTRIIINYINYNTITTNNNYGIKFLEGKINIESTGTPIIDTSYPILTSNSPISSIYSLFSRKTPWAMYFAEDFNTTTNILPNYINNGRNATTTGTITKEKASGNGTTGAITYIKGDTTTTVTFPNDSIPTTFTICSLTRYTGGTSARILQGTNNNWLHGHWGGIRATVHYNGWKTTGGVGTTTDWLCMIGKNGGTTPTNILADGIAIGTATGGTSGLNLRINAGEYSGEKSNWALSCVMIWDTNLTDNEMLDVNTMINNYKNNGISIKDIYNSTLSPVLWYKFNDNSTNYLNSEINSAYNLINSSTTYDTTTFIKGTGSIKFTASGSQYVTIPSAAINLNAVNILNGISFSLWVKFGSNSGVWARVLDFGQEDRVNWIIIAKPGNDNTIQCNILYSGVHNFSITLPNILAYDGTWKHIVWTISNTGKWTIYVNNVRIVYIDDTQSYLIPPFTGSTKYYLGKSQYPDGYFDGNIDDFRIYDFVLTYAQVSELYTGRVEISNIQTLTNIDDGNGSGSGGLSLQKSDRTISSNSRFNGFGNNGGTVNLTYSGGGGGADTVGGNAIGTTAGNGGNAKLISITGSNEYYAAGGGGSGNGTYGLGGIGATNIYLGGIGIHNTSTIFTSNAVANTGSGGGGSYNGKGGNGSAGICILKYNPYITYPKYDSNLTLTNVNWTGLPNQLTTRINTLNYIVAFSNSYNAYGGNWPHILLDRNTSTNWRVGINQFNGFYNGTGFLVNDFTGEWVWYKLPYAIMLKEYKISAIGEGCPRLWKIYGSNDSINWDEITNASVIDDYAIFTSGVFTNTLTSFSKPYKFIGLCITYADGSGSGSIVTDGFEISGLVYNLTNFKYTELIYTPTYTWQFFNNTYVSSGTTYTDYLKSSNTIDSILKTAFSSTTTLGVYIYDGPDISYTIWRVYIITISSTITSLYTNKNLIGTAYPNNRYAYIHIARATTNGVYQTQTYASLTNTSIYVKPSSIYANYTGDGLFIYNGSSIKQWNDISGNNRHMTKYRGTPLQTTFTGGTNGINGTSTFNTVSGTTIDGFQLPFKLPNSYTFAYVARYKGATRGRIFDAAIGVNNCIWGFHGDTVGRTHYKGIGWKTSTDTKTSNPYCWLIGIETEESCRFNGIDFANKYIKQNNYSFPPRLGYRPVITINYGYGSGEYYGETSDWEIAEIIIYDSELTEDEQIKLENYLAIKYNHFSFKSVVPDFNTYSGLTQVSKTDGWHNIWNGGRYIYKTSPVAKWYGPGLGTFFTYNSKWYWGYSVTNTEASYISGYSSHNNLNYIYNIKIPENANNIHLIVGGGGGGGGGNYGAGGGGAGLVYMPNIYNLENTKLYLSIGARGRGGYYQNTDVYTTSGGDTSIQFIRNNTSYIINANGGAQGGQGTRAYGIGGNYGYTPNQYPPIKFTTATSETTTTAVLGKTSYTQTISLSSNIFYGGGDYIIYSSSTYGAYYKSLLFEYTDTSFDTAGCHFQYAIYNSSGVYTSTNFIISGYTGDWIIIKFPKPISLSHYDVFARRGVLYRAPAEWKFYGSNDGTSFTEIVEGSQATRLATTDYNAYFCYTKIVNSLTKYNYYGICINKLAGSGVENPSILNFSQLRFYGDEYYLYNTEFISTDYTYPPSTITSFTPSTPSPILVSFLNNNTGNYSTAINISSSQTYGNGSYVIYANSSTTKYQLLTSISSSTVVSWDVTKYDSTGVYLTASTGKISQEVYAINYKGDWVVIQLPKPIIITSYRITASSVNPNNAPGEWKMYCSNDGNIFYEFPAGSVTTRIGTGNYSSFVYTKSVILQAIPYLYYGFVFNKLAGNATTLIFGGISFTGKETLNLAFKGFSGGIGVTVDNNNYLGGALYPISETLNSTSLLPLLTSQFGIVSQNSTSVDGNNSSGNGGLGSRDAIVSENNARHGQNGGWGFGVILFDTSQNDGSSLEKAALSGWHLAQYSKSNNLNLPSGTYWIKSPTMPNALQMYVDMTRDGGGYDFYRFTTATSCNYVTQNTGASALGLDLFYPRSKDHWAAIYNFVVNVSGSSIANDVKTVGAVHKNTGGGNYISTVMRNSRYYATGTTDWRVPDDGKWFIRDTTYVEPNGNYTANAFLGLGTLGSDGSVTAFDDGNDSFSTGTTIICSTNIKGSSFVETSNDGSSLEKAALSGWHLAEYSKTYNLNLPSGTYWIKSPQMPYALQMYVDMARDGGGYDFYRFTGATSCNYVTQNTGASALGLDIFYPRSKEHWAAIYNFVVTVSNSTIVNDIKTVGAVYKTTGGGNYTTTVMRNSRYYATGTTDWRVPDDGKWFIRDTTYVEPNGNYTANAFLGLGTLGSDGSVTAFDDNNAGFSTGTIIICSTNIKGSLFVETSNDGSSSEKAALSGWHLAQYSKINNLNLPSGTYWIKSLQMPNALQMYVDMTRDGGGYDFYRFTSATSCNYVTQSTGASALGLDLFYPRSKEHWAAIYNFVVSISGSTIANDIKTVGAVHKTTGGGNYTGTVMRSSNYYATGTIDWRVPDDGKWYIRDTTHTEPNGDYTANAFLGLITLLSDGSVTLFNDGNAGYSTGTIIICSTNVKGSSYYN